MKDIQFINSPHGEAQYAVLPIKVYQDLIARSGDSALPSSPSLLSEDKRYIRLPNAGPSMWLDVLRFADLCSRRSLSFIAINQRAQTLDKFDPGQAFTLDPILRRVFLPDDSPYKNTMQASNEVVDALVETGMFKRSMRPFPAFYRPVKSLDVIETELEAFRLSHKDTPREGFDHLELVIV